MCPSICSAKGRRGVGFKSNFLGNKNHKQNETWGYKHYQAELKVAPPGTDISPSKMIRKMTFHSEVVGICLFSEVYFEGYFYTTCLCGSAWVQDFFFAGQSLGPKPTTLPETNSKRHLKMDGWNTFSFPFGILPIFRGELLVSGSVRFSV